MLIPNLKQLMTERQATLMDLSAASGIHHNKINDARQGREIHDYWGECLLQSLSQDTFGYRKRGRPKGSKNVNPYVRRKS